MNKTQTLTIPTWEILLMARMGYELVISNIKTKIGELEGRLESEKGTFPFSPLPPELRDEKPKRKMSPAGRKAIADAQKRRWAAKRAEKALAADQLGLRKTAARIREIGASKPKRKLSAAGRKAIIAAQKKRWAKKAE